MGKRDVTDVMGYQDLQGRRGTKGTQEDQGDPLDYRVQEGNKVLLDLPDHLVEGEQFIQDGVGQCVLTLVEHN